MALSGPAQRALGWRVVDPDPAARALPRCRFERALDAGPGKRPVPPRADGEQRVANDDRIAIHGQASTADRVEPVGRLLAVPISRIEIVIARTCHQATFLRYGGKTGRQGPDRYPPPN